MCSAKTSTSTDRLIERAEAAGLVLMPWPDGTLSVFGDQGADEYLMYEIVSRSGAVVAAIHRRTLPAKEVAAAR